MHIQIRLYATLRRYMPNDADQHQIRSGETVQTLLETLGIPVVEAKLIFINACKGQLSSSLKNGDRVAVFPPVGGG